MSTDSQDNNNITQVDWWSGASLFIGFFALSAGFLYIVFSSSMLLPFASHNDLGLFRFKDRAASTNYYDCYFSLAPNISLADMFKCLLLKYVRQLIDLSAIRTIATIILALGAAALAMTLYSFKLRKSVSLALAASIFTLPGFLTLNMNAGAMALAASFTFAVISHALIYNITPFDLRKRLFSFKTISWGAPAFISLIVCADFYPLGIIFFFVPTVAMLLFKNIDEWPDTRLQFLRNCGLFIVAGLVYFLFYRSYTFTVTMNFLDRLLLLAGKLNVKSLNLWNIYSDIYLALIVLAFIVFGIVTAARAYSKLPKLLQRKKYVIQRAVAIFAVMVITNIAALIGVQGFDSFLVLVSYQALVVILLFWALTKVIIYLPQEYRQAAIPAAAVGLMLVGGILGQRHVFDTSINQHIARSYIRAHITHRLDHLRAVHFILLSNVNRSYTNFPIVPVVDDFNLHHEEYGYAEVVRSILIDHRDRLKSKNALSVVLVDYEKQKQALENFPGTIVTTSKLGESIHAPPYATIIDMNDLMFPPLAPKPPIPYAPDPPAEISHAKKWRGKASASTQGAEKLIDGVIDPTSMWDAGSSGGWWQYDFGIMSAKIIAEYVMYGWDAANNAPRTWTLEGSKDGAKWTILDAQKNVNWVDAEIKAFYIFKPASYRYYRLNITGGDPGGLARLLEMKLIEFSTVNEAGHQGNGQQRLWQGSINDYWEVIKPYPHQIQMNFASRFKAAIYYLQTGDIGPDTGSKMPTAWVLQGLNNGKKWIDLDVRNQQPPWGKLEKRTFNITNPGKYNRYRFNFTSGGDPNSIRIYKLRILP